MSDIQESYSFGPFLLEATRMVVSCEGRSIGLSATEFKILKVLVVAASSGHDADVTYDQLRTATGMDVANNTVTKHVTAIRPKLYRKGFNEGASRKPTSQDLNEFIRNTSGGYRLTIRSVPLESSAPDPDTGSEMPGQLLADAAPAGGVDHRAVNHRGVNHKDPPYPGSRAFRPDDAAFFFGREPERRDLISALAKDRVVLLYSPSGAGKTSLINVALRTGEVASQYHVLYASHVGLPSTALAGTANNPYTMAALAALEGDGHRVDLPSPTWTEYMKAFFAGKAGDGKEVVLVIDQLEEIITTAPYARYEKARRDFFLELSSALWDHPSLRLVLSFREEFYVQMLRVASDITDQRKLPQWTAAPFALSQLTPDNARAAITGPADRQGVQYKPAVLEALINELAPDQYEDALKRKHGQAEPLHLQVVCRALWEILSDGRRSISFEEIEHALSAVTRTKSSQVRGREAVTLFVKSVLQNFCGYAIERVSSDTSVDVERIDLGCQQFISKSGFRRFVHQDAEYTGDLPNAVVSALERQQLLHSEQRGTERLFGLAHDKLIEPIRERAELAVHRRRRSRFPRAVAVLIVSVFAAIAAVAVTMIIRGFVAMPRFTLTQAADVGWAAGWFHGVIGALVWAVFIAVGLSSSWFFAEAGAARQSWWRGAMVGAASGLLGGVFITIALLKAQRSDSLWAALWVSAKDAPWTAFTITGMGYSMLFFGTGVGFGSGATATRILLRAPWETLIKRHAKPTNWVGTRRVIGSIVRLVVVQNFWLVLLPMAAVTVGCGLVVQFFRLHFPQPQLHEAFSRASASLQARLAGECISITCGGLALVVGLLFGMFLLRKGIDVPDEKIFSLIPDDEPAESA